MAESVYLTHEVVELVHRTIACSNWLAEGLATSRGEIAAMRERIIEWRGRVAFMFYVAAAANMFTWCSAALGQLCLASWRHRRLAMMKARAA
jgi:hypothetical protein